MDTDEHIAKLRDRLADIETEAVKIRKILKAVDAADDCQAASQIKPEPVAPLVADPIYSHPPMQITLPAVCNCGTIWGIVGPIPPCPVHGHATWMPQAGSVKTITSGFAGISPMPCLTDYAGSCTIYHNRCKDTYQA